MSDEAEDAIQAAAKAGLPVNLRRRREPPSPSSSIAPEDRPDAPTSPTSGRPEGPGPDVDRGNDDTFPAGPGLDDPDDTPIETLTWRDGRLVLVKEQPIKGRTHETRQTRLQPDTGPAGTDP